MAEYTSKILENLNILKENAVLIVIGTLSLYTLYGIIYRLYLSPISSFPGPKLAGLTFWYEFYYDIYPHYGQYAFKIRDLHAEYGPIIRINPYELHISTPQFFETLYSTNKKRDKWAWMTRMMGMPTSTFATPDHGDHRIRRAALNPFFSVASVRRLEPVIQERVNLSVNRIRELANTGKIQKLVLITSAFGNDVILQYCFGRSQNRLERPDLGEEIYEASHEAAIMAPTIKHNIWMLWIIQSLPPSIVKKLGPPLRMFTEMKQGFYQQVKDIASEKDLAHKDVDHLTVFHELLNSKLPVRDKSFERLSDEALSVVGAGGETISWALNVATYHLLADARILRKLKEELRSAIPDPNVETPAAVLEQLPYLNGVVKECLRLSYGVSTRSQRSTYEPLPFSTPEKEWIIPPKVPVSMTSLLLHHDESIYPSSHTFALAR